MQFKLKIDNQEIILDAYIANEIVMQGSQWHPGVQIVEPAPMSLVRLFGEDTAYFLREVLENRVNEGQESKGTFEGMDNFDSDMPMVPTFTWELIATADEQRELKLDE